MSRTSSHRYWMAYLSEATEFAFPSRFAALLRLWVHRLPSQSPAGGYLSWHRASQWEDWVLAALSEFPTPDLPPPPTLPEGFLAPFEADDPWRQSAPLAELYLMLQRRRLPTEERRRRGLVFTPRQTADALVAQLEPVVLPPITDPLRILDPSSGGGMFWEALIAQRMRPLESHERAAAYADLLLTHLYAVERDSLLAALVDVRARAGWYGLQLLQNGLAAAEFPEPPESLTPHIACLDTLERSAWPVGWPTHFDVVIGNPPYGFAESIPGEELSRLSRAYEVAQGAFDRSWVFIERGIELLRADGVLAYLIPDALLVRPRARNLRRMIANSTNILSTSSVGTIFPGAGVGGAFLLIRKRSQPAEQLLGESFQATDALFRRHLDVHPTADSSGVRLGDLCMISRGEELGVRACQSLSDNPELVPILCGRDLSMLGAAVPRLGIAGPLRKPDAVYAAPKIMVVKTGAAPTIGLDLEAGHATLQSIYNVHLRDDVPEGIALALLAWLMACEAGQAEFRKFTAGKTLFPQLNQQMLAAFELPPILTLQALSAELLLACPHFVATGLLTAPERDAIAGLGLA